MSEFGSFVDYNPIFLVEIMKNYVDFSKNCLSGVKILRATRAFHQNRFSFMFPTPNLSIFFVFYHCKFINTLIDRPPKCLRSNTLIEKIYNKNLEVFSSICADSGLKMFDVSPKRGGPVPPPFRIFRHLFMEIADRKWPHHCIRPMVFYLFTAKIHQ